MEWTVQGQRAYAYTGGKPFDPALPCVVFVHGAQNDHSVWGLQTRWFAHHGFSVLAVDLPAHGRSEGAPLQTVEAMADWVMTLVQAAGVTQPVMVVGHSMGSLIALECASRYADHVRRIALVATAWPMKVSDALLDAALNNTPAAIDMVNTWSHSGLANKPSAPGPGFWMHGVSQRLMERVARGSEAPVFHTDFSACNAYARGVEAMPAVQCPSLVIVGEKDLMTPAKVGRQVAAGLKGSRVVSLPCGHAVMGECPDGTLDALIAFAREFAGEGEPAAA